MHGVWPLETGVDRDGLLTSINAGLERWILSIDSILIPSSCPCWTRPNASQLLTPLHSFSWDSLLVTSHQIQPMEILVQIPAPLQAVVEWAIAIWTSLQNSWIGVYGLTQILRESAMRLFELQYNNILLPILAGALFFWPLVVSLVMSLATAWTWIFWLFASIVLSLVQVLYATYQFFMITMDLMGLSTLKTYTIARNQWRNLLDRITDGPRGRQSTRRRWKERTSACTSYEEFLKIRVEPKRVVSTYRDRALGIPELHRSFSFNGTISSVGAERETATLQQRRNRSFSGNIPRDEEVVRDPVVVEELGAQNANLLVTTTERLEEARLAVQTNPRDAEAVKTLQYLLSGVVKRNHLTVDDILVENARSIAVSGEYGLSKQARQIVRSYLREVENGLNWIADATDVQSAEEVAENMALVRKMKQNMGRTALMLSGGKYSTFSQQEALFDINILSKQSM